MRAGGEAWEGITNMTIRELIYNAINWFKESYSDIENWFKEGLVNIVNGNFLDLTILQAILSLIVVFFFVCGVVVPVVAVVYTFISNRRLIKSNITWAEQGRVVSQYELGKMYSNGDGVAQDFIHAYKWYEISWANGYEDGFRSRDLIEVKMSSDQITEAKKLAREWIEKHKKNMPL